MNIPPFILTIVFPLAATPLAYLTGRLEAKALARSGRPLHLPRGVALTAMFGAWITFLVSILDAAGGSVESSSLPLAADGLSTLLIFVALSLGTLVALYSGPYAAGKPGEEKYYALLLAMVGAIAGLACARDLFNLWVWFEAMAASSYLLVAFESTQATSLEAGLKYLVQSAAGSALILIGVALILAQTGSLSFSGVQQTRLSPGMLAAGALFVVGFGVKSALVPMHTWLPDAHAQAPGGISAMMSGVVIEAALVALLRLLTALAAPSWAELLMAAGALNMFVGNLLALQQTQVKRLLAYSSLSHMGYILLGVGIGLYSGQTEGTQGGLFHLLNHGMMKGLAFLVAGALLYALRPGSDDYTPLTIGDLGGAAQRYPFAALALSIALLGLGGLPPLAGFMSKWQIFVAGFATHNVWVIGLVVFAAFNSVLSLAYYMPLVNALYRRQPSRTVTQGSRLPLIMQIPCVLLTLAILVLGIWPSLSTWLTGPASNGLIKALGG